MKVIKVHKSVNQTMELFLRLGFWHRGGEKATATQSSIKWFYLIYSWLFPISLIVGVDGAMKSDNTDECICLIETAILTAVLSIKLVCILWDQEEIVQLLNGFGVHAIDDSMMMFFHGMHFSRCAIRWK